MHTVKLFALIFVILMAGVYVQADQKQGPPAATGSTADKAKDEAKSAPAPVKVALDSADAELVKKQEALLTELIRQANEQLGKERGVLQGIMASAAAKSALKARPPCQANQQGQIVNIPCYRLVEPPEGEYALLEVLPPPPQPPPSPSPTPTPTPPKQ